jgi:hypothetical protein
MVRRVHNGVQQMKSIDTAPLIFAKAAHACQFADCFVTTGLRMKATIDVFPVTALCVVQFLRALEICKVMKV